MTRLVDADALVEKARIFEYPHGDSITSEPGVLLTDIEEQPEVDAIPLDWIRQWHQQRVSGRKNYKAAITMVIRELLDAWDAERNKE